MSLMCIVDNTLTHLIGDFSRFNSIRKCGQMIWILLHILQRLILSSPNNQGHTFLFDLL
jgi:uncharacterized membrane protein